MPSPIPMRQVVGAERGDHSVPLCRGRPGPSPKVYARVEAGRRWYTEAMVATRSDLEIHASEALLESLGGSATDAEDELRFLLVAKLFELGRISVGRAAELCGMPRARFMQRLGAIGVPVINIPDDQIALELRDE